MQAVIQLSLELPLELWVIEISRMEFEVVRVYGNRRVTEIDSNFNPFAPGVRRKIQQGMLIECKLLKNTLQSGVGCIGHRMILTGVAPMRSGWNSDRGGLRRNQIF
jgi:hypothetical protein